MIASGEQQRDSTIRMRVSILPQPPFPSRLPHNVEQSSVCYTVVPYWLSILNIAMCTCLSHLLFSHSFMSNSVTPWTAARQASLSFTNSRSLLKLMSIESVIPSNHLIFCCPLLLLPSVFPSIRGFSSESVLCIRWSNIRASTSASVLPTNIQYWFPLGFTGLIHTP